MDKVIQFVSGRGGGESRSEGAKIAPTCTSKNPAAVGISCLKGNQVEMGRITFVNAVKRFLMRMNPGTLGSPPRCLRSGRWMGFGNMSNSSLKNSGRKQLVGVVNSRKGRVKGRMRDTSGLRKVRPACGRVVPM